jgi:hypothetical protein
MQGRSQTFDNNISVPGDNWLEQKVMKRELTDILNKESISAKAESAQDVRQGFLEDLNRKAELRSGISKKSEELKRIQQEKLAQQAAEYREKLRRRMPESLREPGRD